MSPSIRMCQCRVSACVRAHVCEHTYNNVLMCIGANHPDIWLGHSQFEGSSPIPARQTIMNFSQPELANSDPADSSNIIMPCRISSSFGCSLIDMADPRKVNGTKIMQDAGIECWWYHYRHVNVDNQYSIFN